MGTSGTASGPSLYPEIDCVRPLLTPALADWAEQRAERLGIGADRALVTARLLEDETYIRSLAASLGITFEPLDEMPRSRCLLNDKELIDKAAIGLLPIADGPATAIVIAPSGTAARGLIGLIARDPAIRARFRLTTAERFNRFVLRAGGTALIRHASEDLKRRSPALAVGARHHVSRLSMAAIAALLLAAAVLAPAASLMLLELTLSALFLAWLGLRLVGAVVGALPRAPDKALPDRDLPVYSVIAAVYREARSVGGLLAAIERLDYPALGSKCTKAIMAI